MAGKWVPGQGRFKFDSAVAPEFVCVIPTQRHTKDVLLFIKYLNVAASGKLPRQKSLTYCGTLSVSPDAILNQRLNHIRRMCSASVSLDNYMENNDPIENTVSLLHIIILLVLVEIIIWKIMTPSKIRSVYYIELSCLC